MTVGIKIDYERDGSSFMIRLTAHDDPVTFTSLVTLADPNENVFTRMKDHPAVRGKEGEELVKAILTHADGSIFKVERFKDGQPCDGPNGEPALIEFSDKYLKVNLYRGGKLNDGPNGEPAVQIMERTKDGFRPAAGTKSYEDGVEAPLKDGGIRFSVKIPGQWAARGGAILTAEDAVQNKSGVKPAAPKA